MQAHPNSSPLGVNIRPFLKRILLLLMVVSGGVQRCSAQGLVPFPSGLWYQDTTPRPSPSPIDPKKAGEAFQWYLKEAAKGNSDSQVNVALIYLLGEGVPVNTQEGIRWMEKASRQGNPKADTALGAFFFTKPSWLEGSQLVKSREDALRLLERSAKRGHPEGERIYGNILFDGTAGVPKDEKAGISWMIRAARHRDEMARKYLLMLRPKDPADWILMNRSALEWQDPWAAFHLGMAYLLGDGVPHDPAQGYDWIRKAAESGLSVAQSCLGLGYQHGDQMEVDHKEAVRWLRKAAEQGRGDAQNAIGNAYWTGEGVQKDPAKALQWYFLAAAQGEPLAFCNIGYAYEQGIGTVKNRDEAAKWYSMGVSHGSPLAGTLLEALRKGSTNIPGSTAGTVEKKAAK
jgi:hypothetical protein